mgnify:CR=1 FL=1
MNILVTKSNSSVAMGVIKSIPKEHNIISVGFDEYSPIGNFVNKNYKIEDLNDIYDIIKKEKIDLLFPIDEDVLFVSKNHKVFEDLGVKFLISDFDDISYCDDKLNFNRLNNNSEKINSIENLFSLPRKFDNSDAIYEQMYGFLDVLSDEDLTSGSTKKIAMRAEPRYGFGERHTVAHTYEHLTNLQSPDVLFVEGEWGMTNYRIDILCDSNSNIVSSVCREVITQDRGLELKIKVVDFNVKIFDKMCRILNIKGPVSFYCESNDPNGEFKLDNVNCNFSSGVYFNTLAGSNFTKIIIDILQNKDVTPVNPNNILAHRYNTEIIDESL